MKKNISISLEEDLIENFTVLANHLGTNRTNLISMVMTDAINRNELKFSRDYLEMSFDSFSEEENKSLIEKGGKTVSNIFSTLDSQIGK